MGRTGSEADRRCRGSLYERNPRSGPLSPKPVEQLALLWGRDHATLGAHVVAAVDDALAIAMSAGAQPKLPPALDTNEDVGAVIRGARAALLVVADGHFGREASEAAVGHVVRTLGDDPPTADMSDEQLVGVFFDAGVAVQRETTRADCVHPNSRTTLALALVTDQLVQWASFGDSCVVIATSEATSRLDAPRHVYLGNRFTVDDVAGALVRGTRAVRAGSRIVLATDGLIDGLRSEEVDLVAVVSQMRPARTAAEVAAGLVSRVLRHGVADAVTVAVSTA